jgi:TonB family protein
MNKRQTLLPALIFDALLILGSGVQAQIPAGPTDPAIAQLATRIAQPLQKIHGGKVIVADLRGPDGQNHPVAKWLADQVSASLAKSFPDLDVITRPTDQDSIGVGTPDSLGEAQRIAKEWAVKQGAKIIITGSFARVPQGIGVSLSAEYSSGSPQFLSQANGLVPISSEIAALSSETIPSAKSGIARAGVGGTGIPICIHCPSPDYSDEARAARYQGTVVLQVTVTTDGRAVDIAVLKTPGMGLETLALNAVRKWKFKPAPGPDGSPVAAVVPIEVTFRLLKQ